jgi:hypothetical protein
MRVKAQGVIGQRRTLWFLAYDLAEGGRLRRVGWL